MNTTTETQRAELRADLCQFIGTTQYFTTMFPRLFHTDGATYLAEKCEAFWLLDAIGSYQPHIRKAERFKSLRRFQVWRLKVNADKTALLTCQSDSDRPPLITQKYEYTTFPLESIELWVESGDDGKGEYWVVMLPSEH
jgi:hypothetical protein